MTILNIRKAERSGSKVVLGIAGQSGSGKTLTALYIARGMVDSADQIGFLDTENKRGSLYSDELDAPFLIGDLYPPFTPKRYSDAIKEFQAAGVKVLIIDSVTHEWEGEGGCIDIAENTSSKIADWKKAKSEHKKFMNVLLQADMDIIVCVRAREQMDFSNPREPKSIGIQPVCEKNFMFEMTASVMMCNEGKQQQHLKVPKELKPVFGAGNDYIGEKQGKAIRKWVSEGAPVDPEIKRYENALQQATSGGMKELSKVWLSVPKHLKPLLEAHKDQCKASAEAYDETAQETNPVQAKQGFTPASKPEPEPEPEAPKTEVKAEKSIEEF